MGWDGMGFCQVGAMYPVDPAGNLLRIYGWTSPESGDSAPYLRELVRIRRDDSNQGVSYSMHRYGASVNMR